MMNCSDFRTHVVEYLDGRLPADRAEAARAHLESCPECRREADLHRRTWELVGRLETLKPAPGLASSVRRRIRRSRIFAVAGSCAAAAALAVALILSLHKPAAVVDSEFATLPHEDRRLLEELAKDRTWELADNIDLIRAYELLDGAPAPEEDH